MNRSRRVCLCALLPLLAIPLVVHSAAKSSAVRPVEGRTYYGCCDRCKGKLKDDPASRSDVDPVSGKKVDKASAVIGADTDDKVYFFENADTSKKFQPREGRK